ncbi:putative late blight resistance protein homolog R1A-3 [Primulina huaijiensis]|uniref:putative late blight resistance protein homolog R1A-3 n=1 Tax=Primulina huaijiensis TaxID=1492673 RepID=UPI003CC775FE
MAHTAVLSLVNTLEQILRSDRFPIFHAKQEIISLYRKSRFLQALLEDSPRRTIQDGLNFLEIRARDVAYQVEDTVESHVFTEILPDDPDSFSSPLDSYPEDHSSGANYDYLQEAINEIDSIVEELQKGRCGLKQLLPRNLLPAGKPRPANISRKKLVGLENEVLELRDRLMGEDSRLCAIPIVGMGGIGKTILARNLFDDLLIKHHFDVRAWVTISEEYHASEVLQSLLKYIGVATDKKRDKSREMLRQSLFQSLKGRRYLIFLDDMWSTKVWDDLKIIFPDDDNGSRIMFTTRLLDVAVYATDSSSPPHQMHFLNHRKSWDLFCQEVFVDKLCPPELEQVGKEIVKNCRGLPLLIAVVGGLVAKANGERGYWEYVAENVNSVAAESDEHCSEILWLSYNHLPNHLKPCFLYFGVFPEDHNISVSKLVKLWVAEGFLKPVPPKRLEEVAEEYLKDLLERNLVFVGRKQPNGTAKTCYVHDLLRELCLKEAQNEKFLHTMNRNANFSDESWSGHRRLSIHLDILKDEDFTDDTNGAIESMLLARSLLLTGRLHSTSPFYKSFGLLRVLDLPGTEFSEFPFEFLYLLNLRYLAFGFQSYPILPSLSILWNLQTLIVTDGQNLLNKEMFPYYKSYCEVELPSEILQMPQLRHVQMTECFLPNPIEGDNTVVLKNMETLASVSDFKCTGEVLRKFPNLKTLEIYYYAFNIGDWSDYHLKNLVHLSKLENLKCIFNWPPNETLLPNLAFPVSLKSLTLSGSALFSKDMRIIGLLPNLEVLKLKEHAFAGDFWESVDGEFCQLKYLHINRAGLLSWRAETSHFPCLEHLKINQCFYLQEIPSGIGEISTLQMIEIDDCSPSAVTSVKQILEEQRDLGNYVLKVHVRRS